MNAGGGAAAAFDTRGFVDAGWATVDDVIPPAMRDRARAAIEACREADGGAKDPLKGYCAAACELFSGGTCPQPAEDE